MPNPDMREVLNARLPRLPASRPPPPPPLRAPELILRCAIATPRPAEKYKKYKKYEDDEHDGEGEAVLCCWGPQPRTTQAGGGGGVQLSSLQPLTTPERACTC